MKLPFWETGVNPITMKKEETMNTLKHHGNPTKVFTIKSDRRFYFELDNFDNR